MGRLLVNGKRHLIQLVGIFRKLLTIMQRSNQSDDDLYKLSQTPCILPHVGNCFLAKSLLVWGRQAPSKTKPKPDERMNFNKLHINN